MVGGFGLSWQAAFGVITLLYFYSHYLFASGAAHIGAMYTAFLSVAIACGALRGLPSCKLREGLVGGHWKCTRVPQRGHCFGALQGLLQCRVGWDMFP